MGRSPAQIRGLFAENLTELVRGEASVASLARKLKINRTQMMRFLDGSAFPRPDVLAAICVHFGVDARIYTEPLSLIRTQTSAGKRLDASFDDVFGQVSQDMLPNGLYSAWSTSCILPRQASHVVVQIFRRDGICYRRFKSHDPVRLQSGAIARYSLPFSLCIGQVIPQRGGFAVFDRIAGKTHLAFSAFKSGYWMHEDIYPGYELWGQSYSDKLQHSHCATVMQAIKPKFSAYLAAARLPLYRDISQVPEEIQVALRLVSSEVPAFHAPEPAPQ